MRKYRPFIEKIAPPPKSGKRLRIYNSYMDAIDSREGRELLFKYNITTRDRLCYALSQWPHECAGFTIIWESGNYRASRIMQIFGVGKHSARVTWREAKRLAHNGYKLFERVYGLGNPRKARELGNTRVGDGYRFRGCGIQQITGGYDHKGYSAKIGCSLDELADPINSLHAALLEWQAKGLNKLADQDNSSKSKRESLLRRITRKINGGYNGLADRRRYLALAYRNVPTNIFDIGDEFEPDVPEITELSLGAEGKDVQELQILLTNAGFHLGRIDGKFGTHTEKALIAFQGSHGLKPTGVFDEKTKAMLVDVGTKRPDRNITKKELKDAGSRTLLALGRVRVWARFLWRIIFGGSATAATAQASGIDVAEKVTNQANRVNNLVGKFAVPDALTDWRVWVMIILLVVGIVLWLIDRWAGEAEDARLDDAQSGANLAR